MTQLRKLAVVLPRYGAELGGGAETLIRDLILRVNGLARHRGSEDRTKFPLLCGIEQIEVWTTCARDHRTWENFNPPGVTQEDGIAVHRFPVDERNLDIFIRREMDIAAGRPLHPEEQLDWLAAGVNSRALYAHIARAGKEFDALLFGPYLFPTTFWGGLIYPEKSLLLPCLHNEPYAYQDVFGVLFRSVRGIICNAPAEARLIADVFSAAQVGAKSAVVGLGFDPDCLEGKSATAPYLLYSGRKEEGKNLHRLIQWFAPLRVRFPELQLILIGSGEIGFMKELPPGVVDRGFVSSEEKRRLMAGAVALCQPSVNESFSIVLMESWLQKTPVLVHGDCDVTREHAVISNGGLYFSNAEEFVTVGERLLSDPMLGRALGENGYRYVTEHYSWSAVLERFDEALALFGFSAGQARAARSEEAASLR